MNKCPKCGSENIVEFGSNEPNVWLGMAKKYQAFDCKNCGAFFRIQLNNSNQISNRQQTEEKK